MESMFSEMQLIVALWVVSSFSRLFVIAFSILDVYIFSFGFIFEQVATSC